MTRSANHACDHTPNRHVKSRNRIQRSNLTDVITQRLALLVGTPPAPHRILATSRTCRRLSPRSPAEPGCSLFPTVSSSRSHDHRRHPALASRRRRRRQSCPHHIHRTLKAPPPHPRRCMVHESWRTPIAICAPFLTPPPRPELPAPRGLRQRVTLSALISARALLPLIYPSTAHPRVMSCRTSTPSSAHQHASNCIISSLPICA